ncbi:MAG: PTS sugar transporter subunit IIC [Holdemanella sp.]
MQTILVLLVAFVAGIEGILDEFEFHQPIVACTLIGLVTNHLVEGLLLGGSLQLIALGWANIGAAVAPDVCLASVISSILMIHGLESAIEARYVIAFSIALAIPLSLVGLSLTKVCRNLAIQLVHKMDETKKSFLLSMDWYLYARNSCFDSYNRIIVDPFICDLFNLGNDSCFNL